MFSNKNIKKNCIKINNILLNENIFILKLQYFIIVNTVFAYQSLKFETCLGWNWWYLDLYRFHNF